MKKLICFLAACMLLFSCDEHLRFEQAQPAGVKALRNIPKALRGTYMKTDSTYLVIGKKVIYEYGEEIIGDPLEKMYAEFEEDKEPGIELIVTDSTATSFAAYMEDESMNVQVKYDEQNPLGLLTIREDKFDLRKGHVIKKKGNAYYINVLRPNDSAWVLRKAVLAGDQLFIYKVKNPKERENLEALTPAKEHYQKDGELEGLMVDPSPEMLDTLFNEFGKKESTYTRVK